MSKTALFCGRRAGAQRELRFGGLFVAALALLAASAQAPLLAGEPDRFDSYFLYNLWEDHPYDEGCDWAENVQGLAHDRDYWYITQTEVLWRIHVSCDLVSVSPSDTTRVKRIFLNDIKELTQEGYNHFGDPCYYAFNGIGYVIVPLEWRGDTKHPAVGVFRASDLSYLRHVHIGDPLKDAAAWAAVDPEGNVYMSHDNDYAAVRRYSVNWAKLDQGGALELSPLADFRLRDEAGNLLDLNAVTGGDITERGSLLYLLSGTMDGHQDNDGINVFDMQTGRRVARSQSKGYSPVNPPPDPDEGRFVYGWSPGLWDYEEPEGITIWDLDDGRAPGIRGQLHALVLDTVWNDVAMKHYTQTIDVERGDSWYEWGSRNLPFNTVNEANDAAWNGCRIRIKANTYPETLTFSKRMEVVAWDGHVVIGQMKP
jgi:hypothetical protein